MNYLLQRSFSNYFRNYKVVITDLLMVVVTAILGGLIFFQSYDKDSNNQCWFDQRNAYNIGFALFYTLTVTVIVSMLAAVLAFPIGNLNSFFFDTLFLISIFSLVEIPIYYREHSAYVYRSDAYYLSKLLIELPIYFILPSIHSFCIYYLIGFGCDTKHLAVFIFAEVSLSFDFKCVFYVQRLLEIFRVFICKINLLKFGH